MKHIVGAWGRAGAAVALVAGAALFGAPSPARADDPLPELSVRTSDNPLRISTVKQDIAITVTNNGTGTAHNVKVTVDFSDVDAALTAEPADYLDRCKFDGRTSVCQIGDLAKHSTYAIEALSLVNDQGAAEGPAGSLTVTVASDEQDALPANNTVGAGVTVVKQMGRATLVPYVVGDFSTADDRVGGGASETRPLYAAVVNEGTTTASSFAVFFEFPWGASLVERYDGCKYFNEWKSTPAEGYVYGPLQANCPVDLSLAPGEAAVFFDESGESAFHVVIGKNLPGPARIAGNFDAAAPYEEQDLAKAAGGNSAAGKVRKMPAAKARAALAKLDDAPIKANEMGTGSPFFIYSKPNTADIGVTAPALQGAVGDTVDLAYDVVNKGPSDAEGPDVVITAPTGTVLLPATSCWTDGTDKEQRPESAKLRCHLQSLFTATGSGNGHVKPTVKLKIKSTPGADGTIVATSSGISTDANKANNTAKIVFGTGTGDGEGDGAGSGNGTGDNGDGDDNAGGGLPVTGTPVALIAGGGALVIALGLGALLLVRRRRVVLEPPQD